MSEVIPKGPRRWAIRWRDAGGAKRQLTISGTKREAQERLARKEAQVADQKLGLRSSADTVSLREAVDLWAAGQERKGRKDLPRQRVRLALVLSLLGEGTPASAVRSLDLIRITPKLGASPATRNRKLAAIRAVLRFCERNSIIDRAPLIEMEPEKPRDRVWIDDEEERFLAAVDELRDAHNRERCRLCFYLLREGGFRISESCGLRWERDVHLDGDAPFLLAPPEAKTRSSAGRPVPIDPQGTLYGLLLEARRPSGPLLSARNGLPWKPATASGQFYRLRKAAGITAWTHDIRRTVSVELCDEGAEESARAAFLGHSSVATTRKHYSAKRKAEALARALGRASTTNGPADAPRPPDAIPAKNPASGEGASQAQTTKKGGPH